VFRLREDLTGKWSGTFVVTVGEQPAKEDNAYMIATQKGADLTGSIGPNESEQYPILKGKIATVKEAGKDVTKVFVRRAAGQRSRLAHCELSIVDGHLKGKLTAEHDGQKISAVLDLTRVK
jgi:hypothetical protein